MTDGTGRSGPRVLVLADDLTGANATAVRFARRGMRTLVTGGPPRTCVSAPDVLVLDLASRHLPAAQAARRVVAGASVFPDAPLVTKRVDSTLRGNPGAETAALLHVLDARPGPPVRALVVPAHPEAGRTTEGGVHHVHGVPFADSEVARDPFCPVTSSCVVEAFDVIDRPIAHVPLDVVRGDSAGLARALCDPGARVLVCDAVTEADVETLALAAAAAALGGELRWLPVDPGPFGAALVGASGAVPAGPPVLGVAGSLSRLSREQVSETQRRLGARWLDVGDAPDPVRVAADLVALARTGAALTGIRTRVPDRIDPVRAARLPVLLGEVVKRALAAAPFAGVYATGGDIAGAVCTALGADGLAVETEVQPLVVAGRLVGGPHDGLPFAAKGGLVGDTNAAVACALHLRMSFTVQAASPTAVTAREIDDGRR
ncbi:four-carbon acid sugar kinase family protein [Embleya scabrispora]|uniref:four-carbon acid sugar kinase family protein n=1 Tax=Embleya scabrispora TaxID=159449 RepID=UPI000593F729|nr:four-carbon acid sugar kinase family protein [Embleya scabrispora]